MKKLLSALIVAVMLIGMLSMIVIPASAANWTADYRYWSQGASDDYLMRQYGCWVVAQAKMIYEIGINRDSSFNPDVYKEWEYANGHLTSGFYQSSGDKAPVNYAKQRGKTITYHGFVESGSAWKYINGGYYLIAKVNGGGHYVFIDNTTSKNKGVLYCYDSWTDYASVGSQLLSRYSVDGFYVYSGSGSSSPSSISLSWSKYTDKYQVKSTNAVLALRCDLSGVNSSAVSQVGINLYDYGGTRLKSRTETVNLGNYNYFQVWYDVNDELNYTLKPGTTYKFEIMAMVNGKKYYSPVYSFKTSGTHSHQYNNPCSKVCITCGNTRSVSHTYSNACDEECNACGATRSISHKYDNACDISCNVCGATRSVAGHQYLNACDTTCNICGNTRSISHSYSNDCDTSCNICGQTRSVGAHNYGEHRLIKCSSCGTARPDITTTIAYGGIGHAGDYWGVEIRTDGTFVLRENFITREGDVFVGWNAYQLFTNKWFTEEKGWLSEADINSKGYAKKIFSAGVQCDVARDGLTEFNDDKIIFYAVYEPCSVHQYTNSCDSYCNICFYYNSENGHQYDNSCDTSCNKCGYTYSSITHSYGSYIYNNDATSSKDGTKTRTCSVCKKTETVTATGTKLVNPFKDVNLKEYYAEPVLWAVGKSITNGMSADSFAPNNECTRGQIVTFLWRAAGSLEPKSTKNPFVDVKSDAYYYKAVLWAVEKGITTGTSANTFSPDAGCTRGQVVTFLHRAKGKPAASGKNAFADVKSGAYYYDAVRWAVKNSITNGMSATSFAPDATCTRGQIVTFLYRAYK